MQERLLILSGMRDEPVVRNLIRSVAAAGWLLIAVFALLPAQAQAPDAAEPKLKATPKVRHRPRRLGAAISRAAAARTAASGAASPRAGTRRLAARFSRAAHQASRRTLRAARRPLRARRTRSRSSSRSSASGITRAAPRPTSWSSAPIAAGQANDHELAMKLLDAAVLLQPDFADAWNRGRTSTS